MTLLGALPLRGRSNSEPLASADNLKKWMGKILDHRRRTKSESGLTDVGASDGSTAVPDFVPILSNHHLVDIDPRIMICNGTLKKAFTNHTLEGILDQAEKLHCKPKDLFACVEKFKPQDFDLNRETAILAEVAETGYRMYIKSLLFFPSGPKTKPNGAEDLSRHYL
ncbi:MAG: uncharacterized protein KVP18_004020 [Porospora cf. gigantea A]|uniref:uncharacterized protein n=1 Tax=Porospora cf. gigantea A TaxID=2853593 RepID=UPI00355A44C6|nr:MAG: hypothetical protein KVP18_004020 [Porospora cf. gigantea A]